MPLDTRPTSTEGKIAMRRPLRVINKEPNTTVFAKVVNGNSHRLQWAANGHSGDTIRVPLEIIEDIDFLNSLENGVLEVVDGPEEVVEALRFETEEFRRERAEAMAKGADVIDRRQDRDLVGATCIGPAPSGREGTCGRSIIQSAKQQGEQPPLCQHHQHLAPEFYLSEAGSQGEGATESRDGVVRREWRKAQLGPRQKQQ